MSLAVAAPARPIALPALARSAAGSDDAAIVSGRPGPPGGGRHRLRWSTLQRALAFLLPLVPMEIAGGLLSVKYHSVIGDAASRQANGYYVLFSRDPHLAAIGFVWQPLTSITTMPLDLLHGIWPQLTRDFLAASIMSALFMAGTAYQLYRFAEDLGLRWAMRWTLVVVFACNPLIFYFAANGMSEALFLFTLVAGARSMAGWLQTRRFRPLIVSGLWLGLAYGDRNEAAMAALLAAVVVLVVSHRSAVGTVTGRRRVALADGILFSAPFVLSFAGWAIVSKLISGYFFDQFSSIYGTTSQLKSTAVAGQTLSKASQLLFSLRAIESMAPLLVVVAALAAVRAWSSGDLRLLGPVCFLGGVEVFEVLAYTTGSISTSYRYFITAIPLTIMLAACLARPLDKSTTEQTEEWRERIDGRAPRSLVVRRRQRVLATALLGLVAVALVVPGDATTGEAMLHSAAFTPERPQLTYVLDPHSRAARLDPLRRQWQAINALAVSLADLRLHHGGIMVDDFDECIPQLLLESTYPKEYRIPNDQDFVESEGVPYQDGVRYFLVADPGAAGSYNALDALDRRYPGLYANGQGLATLSRQIEMPDCPAFRLYKLLPQTG